MPLLRLSEEAGPRPDITVVRVAGTFDLATLPDFERLLKRLRESGRVKLIVDLAGLDYISSSGLGAFLGVLDPFRAQGGDLVFVRVSERVHRILKVVGFTRLLSLAADETEALARFQAPLPDLPRQLILSPALRDPHSGEAFGLEVLAADGRGMACAAFAGWARLDASVGIVSPAKIGPFKAGVWNGSVVLTGPGAVQLKAVLEDGVSGQSLDAQSSADLELRQNKPPAVLPLTVACPGCRLNLDIHAFNVYRCKGCGEIYFVDKWAHAISLRPGRRDGEDFGRRFSLAFPADVNLLGPVRAFLVAALKEQGYGQDLVNDAEMAVDEAMTNAVEHAYEFDARRTVFVEMDLDKSRARIKVKDQGKAFDPLAVGPVDLEQHVEERRTGGLGVHLMRTIMDSVEYKREDGFNVLTLTKRTGA